MPREKKDAVAVNLKLARQVAEMLDRYCKETGQTKTLAIERMLTNEIRKYYALPEGKRVPR